MNLRCSSHSLFHAILFCAFATTRDDGAPHVVVTHLHPVPFLCPSFSTVQEYVALLDEHGIREIIKDWAMLPPPPFQSDIT